MKNLVAGILGLIVVIVVIFLFATRDNPSGDTVIPSPVTTASATPDILNVNEATKGAVNVPFKILRGDEIAGRKVRIKTDKGDIVFELSPGAPIASSNFIYLVGKKFYDGLTFHRREEGFVIQGGDPKGNGTGGPGYSFPDEQVIGDYAKGVVAMANAGPNTNGSQFFIMLEDTPGLPKSYTIFGKVLEGQEIVDMIAVGDKMTSVSLE